MARTLHAGSGELPGSLVETLAGVDNAIAVQGDVTSHADLVRAFQTVKEVFGVPSFLVHCAFAREIENPLQQDSRSWDRTVGENLSSFHALVRLCSENFGGGGAIVTMTSSMADHTSPLPEGFAAYAVAKAAIERYVSAIAPSLLHADISIYALRPGAIRTERAESELGVAHDWSRWSPAEEVVPIVHSLVTRRPSLGGLSGRVLTRRDVEV